MMEDDTLVDGASVAVEESEGVVTISVDTYDELRELRLKVDGQTEWHYTYSEE
jgi:hypothetical protein